MKTLKVAIAGLGTVGSGVVNLLQSQGDFLQTRTRTKFEIVAVSARDISKPRMFSLPNAVWCDDPLDLVETDADVIVELIGGAGGVAYDLMEKTLVHKKTLVTANKSMLAMHGGKISQLSVHHNTPVYCEASVAGGLPVIKLLREGLSANKIVSVRGILNGTCNYILTLMHQQKREFLDVLQEAQEKGFAEADPSLDVDGGDAGHKLAILSAFAFHTLPNFDEKNISGIRAITLKDIDQALQKNGSLKLIGHAFCDQDNNIQQSVRVEFIDRADPFYNVNDVFNAVEIHASHAGKIFLQGKGAGSEITASAVVADLIDIAMGRYFPLFGEV